MEKWTEVIPYMVRLYCNNCTEEMELKEVLATYPQKYLYRCPNCTIVTYKKEVFPRIDYKESHEGRKYIYD